MSDIPTIKHLYSASWKGKRCFFNYWNLCHKIILVCDWQWATMQSSYFHPLIYSLKHFLSNTHKPEQIKFIIFLQVSIGLCIGTCIKVNYKPVDLYFPIGVFAVKFHMGSRNGYNRKIPLPRAHNVASASGPAQPIHRDTGLAQGVPLCFYKLSAMKYGTFLPQWRRVVWFMPCENIFLLKKMYLQLQTERSCLEQRVSLFQERLMKISQIRASPCILEDASPKWLTDSLEWSHIQLVRRFHPFFSDRDLASGGGSSLLAVEGLLFSRYLRMLTRNQKMHHAFSRHIFAALVNGCLGVPHLGAPCPSWAPCWGWAVPAAEPNLLAWGKEGLGHLKGT